MKDTILLEIRRLLSQRVGALHPFLSETSCINYEERVILGYCAAYKAFRGKKRGKLVTFLDKKAIPAITFLGLAKWTRTELSHLGFKLADRETGKTETVAPLNTPVEAIEKTEEESSEAKT